MDFNNIDVPPIGCLIKVSTKDRVVSGFLVSVKNGVFLLKNNNKFWKHKFQPDVHDYTYQIPESANTKKFKRMAKELNLTVSSSNNSQTFNELYTETETILNNFYTK